MSGEDVVQCRYMAAAYPRPRGMPTEDEIRLMGRLKERADRASKNHRDYVVGVLLNGASFAEVSRVTGLSTNTLQRWKREMES